MTAPNYDIEYISKITQVWPKTIKTWIRNCNNPDSPPFVRLDAVVTLLDGLLKKSDLGFSKKDFERNISGLRGYRGSGILWNPKLPILENHALVRIVVHLIGDGYLPKFMGTA